MSESPRDPHAPRCPVSVVVVAPTAAAVVPFVASLDTRPERDLEIELVLLDDGLSDDDRQHLRQVVGRRPRAVLTDAVRPSDLAGDRVLLVEPGLRLFPRALGQLLAHAADTGADAVVGRVSGLRLAVGDPFLTDRDALRADEHASVLDGGVVLIARDRVRADGLRLRADVDGGRVALLSGPPAATRVVDPPTPGAGAPQVRPGRPTGRWEEGRYRLSLEGTVTNAPADARPVLFLRNSGSGYSVVLPTVGTVDDGSWRCEATVDPETANAGRPLSPGRWHLDAAVVGTGAASPGTTVRAEPRSVALLDTRAVAIGPTATDKWELDVGPVRQSLVVGADAGDATVTESARGSVLRIELPTVHVATSREVAGHLTVGTLTVPARLETVTGRAVLTAFVSGLPGDYPLSTAFGSARSSATGLQLRVAPLGSMTVSAAPTPDTEPGPTSSAKPAEPAAPRPTSTTGSSGSGSGGKGATAPAPLTLRKIAGRAKRGLRRRVKAWRKARGH